jgi:integrase
MRRYLALGRSEERRLLECASVIGRHFGNWTPLYTVAVLNLNSGMRHKEIRTLKFRNVDLVNRLLRVGESKTEAGKGRPIPLIQPAWATLDIWSSRFPNAKLTISSSQPARMDELIPSVPLRTGARRRDAPATKLAWWQALS